MTFPLPARLLSLLAAVTVGCAEGAEVRGAAPRPVGSVLLSNARIRTLDTKGTIATGLLVVDGRVAALAEEEGLAELAARAERTIDLGGAWVVPGLTDAHVRVESLGRQLDGFDLSTAGTWNEVLARAAAACEGLERGAWVVGRGLDALRLAGTPGFGGAALSAACPHHAVALWSADEALVVANERALLAAKLCGPDARRPRVVGGEILYDEEREASGVLLDRATALIAEVAPQPTAADRERWILRAQDHLLQAGLVGVHDIGVSRATIEAYRALDARGALLLRVTAYYDGNGTFEEGELAGLPIAPGASDRFCVPGVALVLDGPLHDRGAALLSPYAGTNEEGRLFLDAKTLRARVAAIVQAGLQPVLVAVGEKANRLALDVCEELRRAMPAAMELRPRIEKAQVVIPKDWPRFPEVVGAVSIQPARYAAYGAEPGALLAALLGEERAAHVLAWRKVAPELGGLAFGSDAPACPVDPLLGMWAARKEERLPPLGQVAAGLDGGAALAGYTSGPAFAARQEGRRGRLILGQQADFTALDVDPVDAPLEQLRAARVLFVGLDGEIVWRR